MNVTYEKYNSRDVARILKLDPSTVSGWCKKGTINFTDVSGPGSKFGRYEISEEEVNYLKELFNTYGKRKAMQHYDKNHMTKVEICDNPIEAEVTMVPLVLTDEPVEKDEHSEKTIKAYEIVSTIRRIQTIKTRLQELEEEREKYNAELESLRKDVMEYL